MEKNLILVVEDIKVCQDFIKFIFEPNPFYKIISARNGRSALEKVNIYMDKIVLVLLDLTLPDICGDELFSIFQSHPKLKHIPVIFQSGFNLDTNNNLEKLIKASKGTTKVETLTKPFDKKQLFAKITKVFGQGWEKYPAKIAKMKSCK